MSFVFIIGTWEYGIWFDIGTIMEVFLWKERDLLVLFFA